MVSASTSGPDEPAGVDRMVERFISLCRKRGLSVTPQRLALYRALASTNEHPTPEMLFESVRRQMPTLSLATVYKAIETFKDLGVARELRVPDDNRMRLDADLSDHHHLVCTRCRKVIDLRFDPADGISVPEEILRGFEVSSCTLQLTGICPEC